MEDFDLLYLIKTPFYMGDSTKAQKEAEDLEIDESDAKNEELKNFFLIRILLELGDLPKLKAFMSQIYEKNDKMVMLSGHMIQYFISKKTDNSIAEEVEVAKKSLSTYPLPLLTILAYMTYLTGDYDNLFFLTSKTKNLELLSIKFWGCLQIFRYDLAKETHLEMVKIDDDNCLTSICEVLLGFTCKPSSLTI